MSKLRSDELVNMEGDGAPSFPQGATSIEPTADNQVATKLYVDSALSAASGNAVSATAPINPAVGSFWTDTSVTPSLLKTWNGSMWIEFAGTAAAAVGVVVSLPSLSATNLEHAPATITASAAQVSNATLFITKWYKDDVEIVGATGSTYVATEPGVYRYEERWADNAGNVLTPSLNKTIELLAIEAPSITIPVAGTGLSDFDYTAESSAIANVGTVDALGDAPAFSTYLYEGNGSSTSSTQTINNGIDISGEGGLVWIKNREATTFHQLFDTERGAGNYIKSSGTSENQSGNNSLSSFNSNGFTLSWNPGVNGDGQNHVSWTFSKAPGFFDIVTYTGSGSARTVSHNLGSVPGMIMVKMTSSSDGWNVYHKDTGETHYLSLNSTGQVVDNDSRWNDTAPTDSVFTVGTDNGVNQNGQTFVAYLFADNPSNEIKCGSYLGNAVGGGSPAVPNQIDCGFRPKFLLIKNAGSDTDWHMFDDQRGDKWIKANSSDTEGFGNPAAIVFNDNGFSLPTGYHHVNQDNTEHIYLAIGSPKITVSNTQLTLTDTTVSKVSDGSLIGGESIDQVLTVGETVQADVSVSTTVSTPVFNATVYKGNSSSGSSNQTKNVDTGINLDTGDGLIIFKQRTGSQPWRWHDTVRGIGYGIESHNSSAQSDYSDQISVSSTGFTVGDTFPYNQMSGVDPSNLEKHSAWTFRKAPGFFDIVTWSGNDVQNRAIPHSLGTTPGCIIVKELGTREWYVYHSGSNLPWTGGTTEGDTSGGQNTGTLVLDKTNAFDSSWGIFTYVNSTAFGVRRSNSELNYSGGNYVAYVFAEDTPLIKCGSYTGTGSYQTIDTGFKPEFVITKSRSHTSDWYVMDSETPGKALYTNDDMPEQTVPIGYVNNGFTVNGANFALNTSGYEYIYIAIAENPEADITSDIYASGTVSASSGNTITLSNTTGTWSTGMKVQGVTTDTKDYPDPIDASAVTFASSQPVVTSGTVSTWDYAEWNLSYDSQFSSVVHEKAVPLTATGTQAGPDSFPIQGGTEYFVRTKYASSLPSGQSDWSAVTRFLTKANVYADDLFSTFLYTGTGSGNSPQSINIGIDMSTEGGLTWIKYRDGAFGNGHYLYDTERPNASLNTTNTDAQNTNDNRLDFTSTGFNVKNDGGDAVNATDYDYVSWNFRKAPGFFDIVTYDGDSVLGREIPHNLGSAPGMIILKKTTDSGAPWVVYHRSTGATHYLNLNNANAAAYHLNSWNLTEPTSTVFTVGNSGDVNGTGHSYVAYIFAHDDQSFGTNGNESIIKCGSYIGDGSSTNHIDLGFEPQFILIKNVSNSNTNWSMFDVMRGMSTGSDSNASRIDANSSAAESDNNPVEPSPTGFTPTRAGSYTNASGDTFIYMAIRRPHKPPTSATEVFDIVTRTSINPNLFTIALPYADSVWNRNRGSASWMVSNRLTDRGWMKFDTTDAESDAGSGNIEWDYNYKVNPYFWTANQSEVNYVLNRAPGFFDVVTYGSVATTTYADIPHNLGVQPELVIVKRRDEPNGSWLVWSTELSKIGLLHRDIAFYEDNLNQYSSEFYNTDPTATTFRVGTSSQINRQGSSPYNYVAYLFATLDGISKVGSYTGTGGNINVDCGFTAGSRFVLIKRTDSTGDWYLWDTERGIVSGNDPYSLLNTTDAEVTNTDYIDPLNAGFTVNSSAPAALNASGGTYLFLAIA